MWHLANGYEDKGCFIADFVGYDDPGHFLGEEAQLAAIMRGRDGACGSAGTLRRYVLDLAAGRLAETVIDAGNFEFCSVDSRCVGRAHRRIYATCGSAPGVLHTGIAAIDTATGVRDTFDFGPAVNAGEPVFAPRADGAPGEGWLITQTYDALADRSAFAVFDADHVSAGPMATIALPDRMAISFHGHWTAR